MCNNKKIAIVPVNGNFNHINNMPNVKKSNAFFPDALQNRIVELEKELVVTKFHLSETQKVLDAIPSCTLHGKNCVPHALDWIKGIIPQTAFNSNTGKAKNESKLIFEKQVRINDVQYFAETYKVPMNIVRKIMRDKGTNGTYEKNRNIIYSALCELGYINQNN